MASKGLSNPYYELRDRYDVIVVGSGYGASIAASRFARAGYSVCVLERGKEYLPKDFPNTATTAVPEMQIVSAEGVEAKLPSNPLGLYNIHLNKEVNVVVGCGLGGTSLINANVSIKPDARVFEDARWPKAFRDDKVGVTAAYQHAADMLKINPYPVGNPGYPELPKAKALRSSATKVGYPASYVDINVNFTVDGANHVGVEQRPCNNCGDCCSGCRYTAKNTLDKNYLPDAKNHGAQIFTQIRVQHVSKETDGSWKVHYLQQPGKPAKGTPAPSFLRAGIVVLGAGSLGSTEILLRSKANGLAVSSQTGKSFSGNGDVLAFSYNADVDVNGIGFGKDEASARHAVGPCITSVIDCRDSNKPLEEGMVIEEGSIPGALGSVLPKIFSAAAAAFGEDTDSGVWDATKESYRQVESLTRGYKYGATRNTQTCLVMAHDGQAGVLDLANDRIRLRWPGYANTPIFKSIKDNMRKATTALGATFLENPITEELLGSRLITVHPLGGCVMGEDRTQGVVDHRCEVFDAAAKDAKATHAGLYVMDGAVVPRALGVNPLFTISAVSERAVAIAVKERNRELSYTFAKAAVHIDDVSSTGVTFTEVMRGFADSKATDFEAAYQAGKAKGTSVAGLSFRLTVTMDDMKRFIENNDHLGSLTGTVECPLLSDAPLSVSEGKFNLFTLAKDDKTIRNMLYRAVITTREGKQFYFAGQKNVRLDGKLSVEQIWDDTSTLYVTIYEGAEESGKVVARGIQKILIPDFVDQLKTVNATRLHDPKESVTAVTRFGTFFFGQLWETYVEEGGVKAA